MTADDIDALYRSHATGMATFFARRTLDAEAAVDLVAETFAVAIAERSRCRRRSADERAAWLYGIARNHLHGWYRRGAIERRALERVGLERPTVTDVDVERLEDIAGPDHGDGALPRRSAPRAAHLDEPHAAAELRRWRMIRRLLLAGAGAGILAGGAVAVAIPQTQSAPAPRSEPATTVPAAAPVVSEVSRVARMRPVPDLGYMRLRASGPVRVAVRAPDPRGGPAWAVREFVAERLAPEGGVVGRSRCVQLGRLHNGGFGWLEADGTFRPVGVRVVGAPTQCVSRRADLGSEAFAEVLSTVTERQRPVADPVQTIVWEIAGPAARAAELAVRGERTPVRFGRAGTMLAVLPAPVRRADVRLGVRVGGRARTAARTRDPE